MRRFPWVSVALLIVLGLLAALTYPVWGEGDFFDADDRPEDEWQFGYLIIGWISVGGALVIGALGVWARAPATLPTALGIVGAGAFAGVWLLEMVQQGDVAGVNTGMVVAFTGVLVAFAASARRMALAPPE